MEGASSTAREKTLKILERLTARVALAETERDTAMSKKSKKREWRNGQVLIFFLCPFFRSIQFPSKEEQGD